LFALEVGGALLRTGDPRAPLDDLPVPASLQELVRDRLALLDPAALVTAQIAAALSRPTVALIDSVMGGRDGVEAAVAAGVVELDGDRVRSAHPLLASVAYAQLPPTRKREVHAALAGILDDPEERGGILRWRGARRRRGRCGARRGRPAGAGSWRAGRGGRAVGAGSPAEPG
jgi:hypothetical protein